MARIMLRLQEQFARQGHEMDLVGSEDVPGRDLPRSVRQCCFPFLWLLPFLGRVRQKGAYDAVIVHSLGAWFYVFLRRLLGALPPCIVFSFGSDEMRWELEEEEERRGHLKRSLRARCLYYPFMVLPARYATRHGQHVIVGATREIDFYHTRYGRDPATVHFVPNGVAREYFICRDYARPATKLLYFGGWEWRKGTRYLIEAFSLVAGRFPDVTLTLAGVGNAERLLKDQFPPECRNRISVIARVPADHTPELYAAHDIFVFPSLFESMSLVVPEAMASGMPVVTTSACGMPDIVDDGVNGFLVPPRNPCQLAERVEALLRDRDLRQCVGQAAQKKAESITWDKIAEQTLKVLERATQGSHGVRG